MADHLETSPYYSANYNAARCYYVLARDSGRFGSSVNSSAPDVSAGCPRDSSGGRPNRIGLDDQDKMSDDAVHARIDIGCTPQRDRWSAFVVPTIEGGCRVPSCAATMDRGRDLAFGGG